MLNRVGTVFPSCKLTGEDSDDETLGGATLHAETSGLGDYFADDEMDALRLCREVVSHLNRQKPGPLAASVVDEPVHDSEELELVGKGIASIKLAVSGAGAAAIACLDVMVGLGVRRENIFMVDSKGVVREGREDFARIDESKLRYCQRTEARTLPFSAAIWRSSSSIWPFSCSISG